MHEEKLKIYMFYFILYRILVINWNPIGSIYAIKTYNMFNVFV